MRLAARFRDVFELPVRQATGVHIVGALVAPQALGIEGHGTASAGVGGRGFTFRRAFESCVGEAAEYQSFPAGFVWSQQCGLFRQLSASLGCLWH